MEADDSAVDAFLADVRRDLDARVLSLPLTRRPDSVPAVLETLPELLGRNFLSDFRVSPGTSVLPWLRGYTGDLNALHRVIAHPEPGSVALDVHYARSGAVAGVSVRRLWTRILAAEVNARLQVLYRCWLVAHPAAIGASPHRAFYLRMHDVLQAAEPLARSLVEAVDLDAVSRWIGGDEPRAIREQLRRDIQSGALQISTLDLRLTYYCNVACRHCFMDGSPQRPKDRISDAQCVRLIREMPVAGLSHLLIGAGEPFVYPDALELMVRTAREVGIPKITLVSNGFWGKTRDGAGRVVQRLHDAGFMSGPGLQEDTLKVSSGAYHLEQGIPLSAIANIAREVRTRCGRPPVVDFEHHGELTRADVMAQLEAAGAPAETPVRMRLVHASGAARQLRDRIQDRPAATFGSPCVELDKIAVEPDGGLRPCCGANHYNQGLLMDAKAGQAPLSVLVSQLWCNPLFQTLATRPAGCRPARTDARRRRRTKDRAPRHAVSAMSRASGMTRRIVLCGDVAAEPEAAGKKRRRTMAARSRQLSLAVTASKPRDDVSISARVAQISASAVGRIRARPSGLQRASQSSGTSAPTRSRANRKLT